MKSSKNSSRLTNKVKKLLKGVTLGSALDDQVTSPEQLKDQPNIKSPVVFGAAVILIFFGTFFLWSWVSPLESAAIAPGKITVDTHQKTIQHLEGGIVSKIFVKEGDLVQAGAALVQLDQTQPGALLDVLLSRSNALHAQEARLIAERDNDNKIIFPKVLLDEQNNPNIMKIIKGQDALFAARQKAYDSTISILKQREEQMKNEIASIHSQVESSDKQLKLINEETEAVAYLEKKKLIERPRLLALLRNAARLKGDRDKDIALIERTKQRIGETKLQAINFKDRWQRDILTELRDTQRELSEVLERQKSAEDVLKRTLILSPRTGTVVDLKLHTIGGVIAPREALMNIVPQQDKLVIEARINPLDIDVVHKGLKAKVKLTAYKQRHVPSLDGEVTQVSADSFTDQQTHETYYLATVIINPGQLKRIKNVKLYPGMPVQVMIITDKRSAFEYFITPIKDSFHRAFREQ